MRIRLLSCRATAPVIRESGEHVRREALQQRAGVDAERVGNPNERVDRQHRATGFIAADVGRVDPGEGREVVLSESSSLALRGDQFADLLGGGGRDSGHPSSVVNVGDLCQG